MSDDRVHPKDPRRDPGSRRARDVPLRGRPGGWSSARDGANFLDIQPIRDARHLNPSPDDTWGLHIVDVNIAYGELERILAAQRASYLAARR